MKQHERILVTGASGQLGQMILERLIKSGQTGLIATTRNPEKLERFAKIGVEVRKADFKDAANLEAAFAGASKILIISTTDIGARAQDQTNAVLAAKKAGAKHIFYTSYPNPDSSVAMVAPDHLATEKAILESGLKYTFLRNSLYAENLLHSLPGAIEYGKLIGCAGDGKATYILRSDCAEAASAALIQAGEYENSAIEITSKNAYSHSDLVNIASEISGKKIVYEDMSPADFRKVSLESGTPEMYIPFFVSFDLDIKKGTISKPSNEFEKLTGHEPYDINEFLNSRLKK